MKPRRCDIIVVGKPKNEFKLRQERNMPPRRGWRILWAEVLQRFRSGRSWAMVAVCKDWPSARTIPRGMEMARNSGWNSCRRPAREKFLTQLYPLNRSKNDHAHRTEMSTVLALRFAERIPYSEIRFAPKTLRRHGAEVLHNDLGHAPGF